MDLHTPDLQPAVEIRTAGARPATKLSWLDSKHSFSFGHHWDPSNTHHGVLLVNNDDVVLAGAGFETHPHRDMEIVTWVLDGSLVHQDSEGNSGVIYPGLAQRMSAGTGILHSEKNDSWRVDDGPQHDRPVRFVQMWVLPDEQGIDPGYEQRELDGRPSRVVSPPWPPAWTATPATRRSASGTAPPPSTPPASRPATPWPCPTPPSPTCSSPAARGARGCRCAGTGRRRPPHRGR